MYGEGDGFGDTLEGVFVLETVYDMATLGEILIRHNTLSAWTEQ